MHIFNSLAEFERDMIKEISAEGRREAKKKRGQVRTTTPAKARTCLDVCPTIS